MIWGYPYFWKHPYWFCAEVYCGMPKAPLVQSRFAIPACTLRGFTSCQVLQSPWLVTWRSSALWFLVATSSRPGVVVLLLWASTKYVQLKASNIHLFFPPDAWRSGLISARFFGPGESIHCRWVSRRVGHHWNHAAGSSHFALASCQQLSEEFSLFLCGGPAVVAKLGSSFKARIFIE